MTTLAEIVALVEAHFGEQCGAQWLSDLHPVLQCSPILLATSAKGRIRLAEYLHNLDRIEAGRAARHRAG